MVATGGVEHELAWRDMKGAVAATDLGTEVVWATSASSPPCRAKWGAAVMPGTDWRSRDDRAGSAPLIRRHPIPRWSEEAKWVKPSNPAGVPAWSRGGIICTGEMYKDKVKLTFFHGASLEDPGHLFNASLDAGTRRAIDIVEGAQLDEQAFQALVRDAVASNIDRAPSKRRA